MLKWPDKDQDEVLDYDLDWSARLDTDTIVTSAWSVTEGSIEIDSSSHSATAAKVWLSGGVDDEDCEIQNRITTAGGRTMDQTVRLRVRSR